MNLILTLVATAPLELRGLIINFIIVVVVLAFVLALLYLIERAGYPLPPFGKVVVAIILVALVLLWAVSVFLPA